MILPSRLFVSTCLAVSLLSITPVKAQVIWVNKNVEVFFGQGMNVTIGGSFLNDSASAFSCSSNIYVEGNFENKGAITHSGVLHLSGDWIQSGVFDPGALSEVNLEGDSQLLTGDSTSHFTILQCLGGGSKIQGNDISTNQLILNDRELKTGSFTFSILDNSPLSLTRTSGYVSSLFEGQLRRNITAGLTYLFPLGFEGTFRPITLQSPVASMPGARYAQADASIEGLQRTFVDSSICQTNALFYHVINDAVDGTSLHIAIETSFAQEWDGLSSRMVSNPAIWEPTLPNSSGQIADSTWFSYVFDESGSRAFLLYKTRPAPPIITGDAEFCALSGPVEYFADEFSNQLIWDIAGGSLNSYDNNSALVTWGSGTSGLLTAVLNDSAGCSSLSATFYVELHPKPEADFNIHSPQFPFEDALYSFESLSQNVAEYFWMISGNQFLNGQYVSYAFPAPGTYEITHIVSTEYQCRDTIVKEIVISEGLIIPDVFSPNGDGINDKLEFPNSGIEKFSFTVFDRWGNTVFFSDQSKFSWDGRSSSGKAVPPGTYFYILSASSPAKAYDKQGSLTIIY